MAIIHPGNTVALFFALLTQILAIKGREIKPPAMKTDLQKTSTNFPHTAVYDKNFPSFEPAHKLPSSNLILDSSNVNNVDINGQGDHQGPKILKNLLSSADGYRQTAPGHILSAGHSIENSNKPNPKNTLEKSSRSPASFPFRASAMAYQNDFRPTLPGISPGAGHAATTKYEKTESRPCLNDKCTEDFRPTTPGDSPGAGHSIINKSDTNTSNQGKRLRVEHTQTGKINDNRSTLPGYNPSAGHPSSEKTIKP